MTNLKLLYYAQESAVRKCHFYNKTANDFKDDVIGEMARKMTNCIMSDIKEIEAMIVDEENRLRAEAEKQRLNVDMIAQLRNLAEKIVAKEQAEQQSHKAQPQTAGAQRMKQAIEEAPYVLVIKWSNPIMGEREYPCQSYKEAEKNFETAKREVHNGNVTEAYVYEQGEGQRVPVMGIMSGKL